MFDIPPGGVVLEEDYVPLAGEITGNQERLYTIRYRRVVELTDIGDGFGFQDKDEDFGVGGAAAGSTAVTVRTFWPPNNVINRPIDPRTDDGSAADQTVFDGEVDDGGFGHQDGPGGNAYGIGSEPDRHYLRGNE